jgi:hypothetical protein
MLYTQRGWSFSPATREFGLARVLSNPSAMFVDNVDSSSEKALAGDGPIAKDRIIKTALEYAVELEAIV